MRDKGGKIEEKNRKQITKKIDSNIIIFIIIVNLIHLNILI